jgi:hypothetical protein
MELWVRSAKSGFNQKFHEMNLAEEFGFVLPNLAFLARRGGGALMSSIFNGTLGFIKYLTA